MNKRGIIEIKYVKFMTRKRGVDFDRHQIARVCAGDLRFHPTRGMFIRPGYLAA